MFILYLGFGLFYLGIAGLGLTVLAAILSIFWKKLQAKHIKTSLFIFTGILGSGVVVLALGFVFGLVIPSI